MVWPRSRRLSGALAIGCSLIAACWPAAAQETEQGASAGAADEPILIEADRLGGRTDQDTVAEGQVEFRRGPISIKAERLEYSQSTDTARASGNVEVRRGGNVFRGPEVQLDVQTFKGWFREPSYFFERTQAGGSAERFEFLDEHRGVAVGATYTSCPAPDPAWVLSTGRVTLDNEAQEGVAEDAVLRFYGVPLLAMPTMSFPLSDARKSGWLPPTINLDNKSGLEAAAPYYLNIAPNRDLTLTPAVFSRRGAGVGAEYRYLEPSYRGTIETHVLPWDRVANRNRWSLLFDHEARWEGSAVGAVDYRIGLQRVSDDDHWKDFSRGVPSQTPRLLPADAQASRRFDSEWGDTLLYARVQSWQVLQDTDPASRIVAPYRREPQVGLRQRGNVGGFEWAWETEVNRFRNEDQVLQSGQRLHALGSLARPWWPTGSPGWTITPRVSFNAATYDLDQPMDDGGRRESRLIPTTALESAWVFEREGQWFGRTLTQTLEPKLLYVYTPYRNQSSLPLFDTAPLDFNFSSIYADNAFSGIDRVSDANQLTVGVTTRFLDRETGAEALRLGLAQRLVIRDQRITPDGQPLTRRWSDLLLLGSTTLVPHWWLDGTLQFDADQSRIARSIVGARWSPGPFRTISVAHRYVRDTAGPVATTLLTRGASDQVEVGWQWPLNQAARDYAVAEEARDAMLRDGRSFPPRPAAAGCRGAWYTVGRVNYSRRDSRVTDSLVGFEYDSGCWIGRIVAERLSTGRSEATTRLLFQLELVGLSRLGSNPLKTLKDNIPGYRLLREDAQVVTPAFSTP